MWETDRSDSMNITVTPNQLGVFNVYIRFALATEGFSFASRDPGSGDVQDQQGYHVYTHEVTVESPDPMIASIMPDKGVIDGGLRVTILGENFDVGTEVQFGETVVTDVKFVSDTELLATTPPSGAVGAVDVSVITSSGEVSVPLQGGFTYVPFGDLSGDGSISAYDAVLVLQFVAGIIDSFPANPFTAPPNITPRDYTLSVAEVSAKMTERVSVPVHIADATGLTSGGIRLTYNPNILKAVDVAPTLVLNGAYWKANPSLPGEVRFAFATAEPATEAREGSQALFNVEFEVLPATEGHVSDLTLESVELVGSKQIHRVHGTLTVLPSESLLLQNYPNPFNPETWLPYQLSEGGDVTLTIYNANGVKVRTLPLGFKQPGHYLTRERAAYWNGRNENGEQVASGVYFYSLQAGQFSAMRKMVILK
jgi:hypothetical protein